MLGEPLDENQLSFLPERLETADEPRIWAINADSPAADTYHNYMGSGDGVLFYKVTRGLAPDEKMYV